MRRAADLPRAGSTASPAVAARIPSPRGLTTRGLGSTLRAKWLARHRPSLALAGAAGRAQGRRRAPLHRARPHRRDDEDANHRRRHRRGGKTALRCPRAKDAGVMRLAMLPYPGVAMGPDPLHAREPAAAADSFVRARDAAHSDYATNIASELSQVPTPISRCSMRRASRYATFAKALANMAAEIGLLSATRARW